MIMPEAELVGISPEDISPDVISTGVCPDGISTVVCPDGISPDDISLVVPPDEISTGVCCVGISPDSPEDPVIDDSPLVSSGELGVSTVGPSVAPGVVSLY